MFGDRSFTNAGPHIWNSLMAEVRAPGLSLDCFKKGLESYLLHWFDLGTGEDL